jgi:serine protease AprX
MRLFLFVLCSVLFLHEVQAAKIGAALEKKLETEETSHILVHLSAKADLSQAEKIQDRTKRIRYVYDRLRLQALNTQGPLLDFLKKKGVEYRSYYISNSVAVENAPKSLIAELSQRKEILSIELNPKLFLLEVNESQTIQNENNSNIPDNLKAVSADRVWDELKVKGMDIVVAGQDSGYAWRHPALRRQYRGNSGISAIHNYSWHDAIHRPLKGDKAGACGVSSPEPCDDSGHGTHTMGSILGDDGAQNKIGVAPEAKWIGCRNMDRGVGIASTYIECFEFFLAPYPKGGDPKVDGMPEMAPHIINNSWACPPSEGCKGDEFVDAIQALHAAGIIVVVSAGNEGPGCSSVANPPGNYLEVTSVGAYDHRSGDIADFSSRGPSTRGGLAPSIAAPGRNIRSAVPSGGINGGQYDYKSGTSMAGPHVAGVIALLWSARPELIGKIDETVGILYRGARPKTSTQSCGSYPGNRVPNAVFGHGYVDAYQSIRAL